MNERLVQLVSMSGEDMGIIKTNLPDEEITRALAMFSSEQFSSMDIFDKIEEYANTNGRETKYERVFLEIFNINGDGEIDANENLVQGRDFITTRKEWLEEARLTGGYGVYNDDEYNVEEE